MATSWLVVELRLLLLDIAGGPPSTSARCPSASARGGASTSRELLEGEEPPPDPRDLDRERRGETLAAAARWPRLPGGGVGGLGRRMPLLALGSGAGPDIVAPEEAEGSPKATAGDTPTTSPKGTTSGAWTEPAAPEEPEAPCLAGLGRGAALD